MAQSVERATQRIEAFPHGGLSGDLAPRRAPLRRTQGFTQRRHRRVQPVGALAQGGEIPGFPRLFHHRIPRQFQQLSAAQRFAEKLAGHLRQLVRFVENNGIRAGQQFGETGFLHRHVGAEQVMVDDQHIRRQRLAAGLGDEAIAQVRAFLAQTVVDGGSHARPDQRGFRDTADLGDIAVTGAPRPGADAAQLGDLLARTQAPAFLGGLPAIVTEIVAAPLQQRDPRRHFQRLAHHRQIPLKQLILQVAGAGRDDDPQSGQQRGHQISVGLAGAGAGFDDQGAAVSQDRGDRLGHLLLRSTRREPRNQPG